MVDAVTAFGGLGDRGRVLEVGCGTGKATVPFAARGFDLVALEPSEEMAAVARRNCAEFPRTSVVVTSFEEWPVEVAAFGIVYSATAWHWVQPEIRLVKAHAAIEADGALGLFWNRTDWPDTPLHHAIEYVYDACALQFSARLPGNSPQDVGRRECVEQLASSELFGAMTEVTHEWRTDYAREQFIELLDTQSNHRLLEPDVRAQLFEGIGRAIDTAGGVMHVAYTVELYCARKVG